MADYELVIAGGTVVTAADQFRADVGIRDGRITAVGLGLRGDRTIDAGGLLVMPGGVDSHCHIEQLQPGGRADEETFVTGSRSALAGGTTTVITFSTQFKGQGLSASLAEYRRRAAAAMVDYSFHQIITDATDDVIQREVPEIVASGIRSLKVFLTYDPLHLDDRQFLRVLAAPGGAARWSRCIARTTTPSPGAPRRCWPTAAPRRSTTPGRARRWSSARPPTAPSRWPSWSTSRSRSSTSRAPRWPTRSPAPRPGG